MIDEYVLYKTFECFPMSMEIFIKYAGYRRLSGAARAERAHIYARLEVKKVKMNIEEDSTFTGPLFIIFGNPIAKVIDQSLIVGNMEQTISMLTELTGLSYKTVLSTVEKLEKLGFIKATRKIGNAQAYRFEVKNELHELLQCAQNLQIKRLEVQIDKL